MKIYSSHCVDVDSKNPTTTSSTMSILCMNGYEYVSPADRIERSEETLTALISRLTAMGLGESVSRWLEGDSADSFFEFKVAPDLALSE